MQQDNKSVDSRTLMAMPTPFGRIFTLDRANWSPEDRGLVSLPAGFWGHMVLVFGEALERGWVRIVTITSPAYSTREYVDYLPVYPTRKNHYVGMSQLKLCNYWNIGTELYKRSYVKTNSVAEVPLDLLQPAYADSGLQFRLRMESAEAVRDRVERWERDAAAEREAAEEVTPNQIEATPNQIARMEQDLADFSIALNSAHGRFEWDTIEAVCTTGDEHVRLLPKDAGGVIEA